MFCVVTACYCNTVPMHVVALGQASTRITCTTCTTTTRCWPVKATWGSFRVCDKFKRAFLLNKLLFRCNISWNRFVSFCWNILYFPHRSQNRVHCQNFCIKTKKHVLDPVEKNTFQNRTNITYCNYANVVACDMNRCATESATEVNIP